MDKIKSGLVILAVALLAGCQQQPNAQLVSKCWNQDTKQNIGSLVKQAISEHIVNAILANDKGNHTKDQVASWVKGRVTSALSNFYVLTADPVTGNVTCSADAAMTFKRADDKTLTASGTSFIYGVYNAEGGSIMYSVTSTLPLAQMVDDATVSPDTESATPSPASASQ